MGKFIVIVLDGFGVGEMPDVAAVRPQDAGSHTAGHILDAVPGLALPNLAALGLANILGRETVGVPFAPQAVYGRAELRHDGADTFFGHQEIMGTDPKKPFTEPIKHKLDAIAALLRENGHTVRYYEGRQERFLVVDECVTVADNIECDPGQAFNVTVALDDIDFGKAMEIGRLVRSLAVVPRVITFGGRGVHLPDMLAAVEENGEYIGVNAPASGVYNEDYHCVHLGYGVDPAVQIPTLLGKQGTPVYLLGKVADVVQNEYGTSIPMVDTAGVLAETLKLVQTVDSGFICTNVQETDLCGHRENVPEYAKKLMVSDEWVGKIRKELENGSSDDILVVMADHGNDPTIGHPHHTRECVPLMLWRRGVEGVDIGVRKSLSDVGATAAEFLGGPAPQNGESFLGLIGGKRL